MRFGSQRAAILLGIALTVAQACGGGEHGPADSHSGELRGCDPLAADEEPITLGTLIAAGRAPDGTLYVADQEPPAEERVFVSEGTTLVRRRVLGSSSSSGPGGQMEYSWLFEDGAVKRRLFVERTASRVTSAVVALDKGDRERANYSDATALTLVEESAVRGLALRNLPGDAVLEYLSRVQDGTLLVVTRPRDDWDYEDFRLFWGPETRVSERKIASVVRARDGGTTRIAFDADGKRYEALFPSLLSMPDSPPSLSASDQVLSLTREDTAAGAPAGASFFCL